MIYNDPIQQLQFTLLHEWHVTIEEVCVCVCCVYVHIYNICNMQIHIVVHLKFHGNTADILYLQAYKSVS